MIINPTEVVENAQGEVVRLTFQTANGTMTINKRQRPNWWRADIYEKNDYLARPRVFVDSDADEELLCGDNTRRATKFWREGAVAMLNAWNLPIANFDLKWSVDAGCRICPCSPGFIMQVEGYSKHDEHSITLRFTLPDGREVRFNRFDINVHLTNALVSA